MYKRCATCHMWWYHVHFYKTLNFILQYNCYSNAMHLVRKTTRRARACFIARAAYRFPVMMYNLTLALLQHQMVNGLYLVPNSILPNMQEKHSQQAVEKPNKFHYLRPKHTIEYNYNKKLAGAEVKKVTSIYILL